MKKLIYILIGTIFSSVAIANDPRPIACKDFHSFLEIKQQVKTLNSKFSWDDPNCKIVLTKSVFPFKNKNGVTTFGKGLEAFIYQNDQLKFVCLPGWMCKAL